MARGGEVNWNEGNLDAMLRGIVKNVLQPRAQAIADACNEASAASPDHQETTTDDEKRGYMTDTQGARPLRKHDYHATVITTTYAAMADNARHNRMVENFHLAEGQDR